MDQQGEEVMQGNLSCWLIFQFFLKHSVKDVKKRKCHFCLAFITIFIVVLSTLMNSGEYLISTVEFYDAIDFKSCLRITSHRLLQYPDYHNVIDLDPYLAIISAI